MVLYFPPRNKKYVCTASMIMTSYFPPPHDFRKQYNNIFITKFRFGGKVVQSSVLIDQSIEKKNVYVAFKSIRQQSIRPTNLVNTSVENTEFRNFQEIYI